MKNLKHFIKALVLLCGLAGLVLFMSNLTQLTKTRFGQAWQTTDGTILSSEVKKSIGISGRPRFYASYKFQFKTAGQTIDITDREDFTEYRRLTYEEAQERIKNFPPGTKVIVHYDPKCPDLPDAAYFDRPHGPRLASYSNMLSTVAGLALMSTAFVLGLFTNWRKILLFVGVQICRLITVFGIIFGFGMLECHYPSAITIIALLVSIPLSVILAIFLFRPCLKAINQMP